MVSYMLQAAVAAAITTILIYLLMPMAARLRMVDMPAGRKDHDVPTPLIGGIAMAGGIVLASLGLIELPPTFQAFLVAGCMLVVLGMLDDLFDLRWFWRLGVQALAALAMVFIGDVRVEQMGPLFGLGDNSLGVLSVPVTVFATVGLINAINMIDGADGLAGSLVLATLVMLVAAALYAGNPNMAERLVLLIGAIGAFLWFNLRLPWQPQARIFMGNAGSALLGLVIAWSCFRLTQNPAHQVSPVLMLWLAPVPVIDCLTLMVRRLRNGRSPFAADHGHIHHLMRAAGFGPTRMIFVLVSFTLGCGLVAGQALRWDVPDWILLVTFVATGLGYYWLTAHRDRAVRLLHGLRLLVRRPWSSRPVPAPHFLASAR